MNEAGKRGRTSGGSPRRRQHFASTAIRDMKCPMCRKALVFALCEGLKERVEPLGKEAAGGRRVFVLQGDRTLVERDGDDVARLLASKVLAEADIYVEHEHGSYAKRAGT